MAKYIRTYSNNSEYEAAKTSADFLTPNVGYIEDTKEVKYLNSKKDLYDIYGTLTGDSATATIVLNENKNYVIRAIDGNEYGFNFPIEVNSFRFDSNDSRGIRTIDKLVFNTNSLTGMSFSNCTQLTNIDLSRVDTSRFTSMAEMFSVCQALTSLDVSHFNTSGVTNMSYMFSGCYVLTSLDVSHFNTSAVKNMQQMFYSCRTLTALDLSSFDTSAVTNMFSLFATCQVLKSLDLSNWNTSAVTNMSSMFSGCLALTTLTMNNTNQTTFDMIKAQLVTDSKASHVTIIRDGVSYKYQNGAWVEVFEEPQPPLAYSLILSNCNPEGDVSNICETQGFCSDSDYYVILMNGDSIATYDGQTVEYEVLGETYHPQLIDPSAGTCVWLCSAFDPSITEVVCYDSDMNQIATLQTSCE